MFSVSSYQQNMLYNDVGKHFQGRKNNEDKKDIKTVKSASTNYERDNDPEIIKDCLKTNEQNSSSDSSVIVVAIMIT
jgi:hypothetical protein